MKHGRLGDSRGSPAREMKRANEGGADGSAPDLVLQDRLASAEVAAAETEQPRDARRFGSKNPFDQCQPVRAALPARLPERVRTGDMSAFCHVRSSV
jgi:hypothetical protein